MKPPLVSICIPTYNRPGELENTLKNIVSQENFDEEIEVLVIDDASSINTRESVKPFYEKFKNIRYLENRTNLGFEKNILKLFKTFKGQYFFFLSDDDSLLPGALTKIEKLIKTHPDCAVFSSGYEQVSKSQKKTTRYRIFKESTTIPRKNIKDIVKLYSDAHVFSRVVLRRDAIDIYGFKRHIDSMYPHMYVIGKAALTGKAFYSSDFLVRHTVENKVFWEYEDDYMIKKQIRMIKDLAKIDQRFYKEAFSMVVVRSIPYIGYHAFRRGPRVFGKLVLALFAVPEIGHNPLVWVKIGAQMISQGFERFLNTYSLLFLFSIYL